MLTVAYFKRRTETLLPVLNQLLDLPLSFIDRFLEEIGRWKGAMGLAPRLDLLDYATASIVGLDKTGHTTDDG